MSARKRIAILISGRGSNMEALIEACGTPDFPAEIAVVLSNVPTAGGLDIARAAGLTTVAIDHRGKTRGAFDAEVNAALRGHSVDFICLAGFMRLLTPGFVESWRDRILNIHPSLLPAYKGLRVHERMIADGVRFAGCTVHIVRPEMDTGPIVVQAVVPVAGDDTAESLAARILPLEHKAYPLALRLLASGRARIEGDRVVITGATANDSYLINPS